MLDGVGSFPACAEGDTTVSTGAGFRVRASSGAPVEVPQYCDLVLDAVGYHDTIRVPLIIGDSMNLPDGPDAGGYAIFDRTDSLYAQRAEYDWVDLRGLGAELGLGSDETVVLPLPEEFGTWRFYGRDYDSLSVCANGFVVAGPSNRVDFVNVRLPYHRAPDNIVAVAWGRLDASAGGSIRFHHDSAGRRVIVEYDSVRYFRDTAFVRVQLQVYDRSVSTPTGDNRIEIHYGTANRFELVTVGLQNHDGSTGLTHYWNRWQPRTAAPLVPGHALAIEAMAPTGTAEPAHTSVPLRLSARPAVFRDRVLVTGEAGSGALAVFDAAGRRVAEVVPERPGEWQWHGRDGSGRACPAGVYFFRAGSAGVRAVFAP